MFAPLNASSPLADRQMKTRLDMAAAISQQRQALTAFFVNQRRQVWKNPLGLTPQEVCDAMGTEAATAFALMAALEQLLTSAMQAAGMDDKIIASTLGAIKPANVKTVANPDGTMTIPEE